MGEDVRVDGPLGHAVHKIWHGQVDNLTRPTEEFPVYVLSSDSSVSPHLALRVGEQPARVVPQSSVGGALLRPRERGCEFQVGMPLAWQLRVSKTLRRSVPPTSRLELSALGSGIDCALIGRPQPNE